jgi:hypothetical protein
MFGTQKIVNRYPLNTRMRQDPSSLGFRMFSVIGDLHQQFDKDLQRLGESYFTKSSHTDIPGEFFEWDINDFVFTFENDYDALAPKIPTVEGDSIALTHCEEYADLIHSLPTSLEETSTYLSYVGLVYSAALSGSGTIYDIEVPGRLTIKLDGVESYQTVADSTKVRSPVLRAQLRLSGEDLHGNEIEEEIFPTRDAVYLTTNVFSKLLSFAFHNIEGTSGTIQIRALDFDIDSHESRFNFVVQPDRRDPLYIEFDENFIYLRYYIFQSVAGSRLEVDKETFCAFALYDEDGDRLSIRDISLTDSTETLVVLSEGQLHFFPNWLPPHFNMPSEDRTREVIVTAEIPNHYPVLDQETVFYLYTRSIEKRVQEVQVTLVDPDGDTFYLNEDREFQTSPWTFQGVNTLAPGDSFLDKKILWTPDKVGQWDLIIVTEDTDGTSYTDVTSVLVPKLVPVKSLSVDASYTDVAAHEDGNFYFSDGTDTFALTPVRDVFLIDTQNKRVFTLRDYTTLNVSY